MLSNKGGTTVIRPFVNSLTKGLFLFYLINNQIDNTNRKIKGAIEMKKGWKKIIGLSLLGAVFLGLAACGNSGDTSETGAAEGGNEEPKTIVVGAGATPHAEILEDVKGRLAEEGYDLEIKVFDDFVLPNTALADGDLDINLYQHEPFLINFNEEHDTDLVVAGDTKYYFLPLGIYPGQTSSLDELADGAKVSIPNDATNGGRALLLLQDAGLIQLKEDADITATVSDIVENPKNLELVELDAAQVVRSLDDVDIAVINANYVLGSDLSVNEDALLTEAKDSQAAETYACVAAVKDGAQDDEAIQAFLAALGSDETREFIEETYQGAVIPVF